MERYAAVLNYAIPFFMTLLLIERIFAWRKNRKVIHSMDTLSSLSSGITNVIKDVLGLTVIIVSYTWFKEHLALFTMESEWYVYVLAFIGLDFAGYWNHRLAHQVNYFWNVHIIHHSSEEFNLACALRQTISSIFSTIPFFLIPTAIIGVPHEVIALIAPLHLFAQYWYHTQLIGKMGFLEHIIVTPSHHRVHHAVNKEYMDKNMSQVFIIWDKLFGTFQEELDDVPPVYGVKRPVRTWNPFLINFNHLWLLVKDAWRARSYWDKLRIWFMPTGWRPQDVEENYPVYAIEDVYGYAKYNPKSSTAMHLWSWTQFFIVFLLMMYLFNNIAAIGAGNALIYGVFLGVMIFNYTTLMDRKMWSVVTSLVQSAVGIAIVILQGGDWFMLNETISFGSYIVLGYFLLSFFITSFFVLTELRVEKKSQLAAS